MNYLSVGQYWDPGKKELRLFVNSRGVCYDVTDRILSLGNCPPSKEILRGQLRSLANSEEQGPEVLFQNEPMRQAFLISGRLGITPFKLFSDAMGSHRDEVAYANYDSTPDIAKHHIAPPFRGPSIGIGVTYARSQEMRDAAAASTFGGTTNFYQLARKAAMEGYRTEAFHKANAPWHFISPRGNAGLRNDLLHDGTPILSAIEPELAGIIDTKTGLAVGYLLANDISANVLEAENPLWLPEAKTFIGCFATGPMMMLLEEPTINVPEFSIRARIQRKDSFPFDQTFNTKEFATPDYGTVIKTLRSNNLHPRYVVVSFGAGAVPSNDGPDRTFQLGDKWDISIDREVNGEPGMKLFGGVAMIPPPDAVTREIGPNYEKTMLEDVILRNR